MSSSPRFSIAIPVYNREKLVARCLRSCLSQSFGNYELLVLDDGSKDRSVEVILSFHDPRIRLQVRERNCGINAAWNTLMQMAKAEWVIVMGSDDEFLPGALETIHFRTEHLANDVACVRFNVRWDNGTTSPVPLYREEIWDYRGYVRHLEQLTGSSEGMTMLRTSLRHEFSYREDRSSETLYLLNVGRRYRTATFPEFTRLYHTDASNQTNKYMPAVEILHRAPDLANAADAIIETHGKYLAEYAPNYYGRIRRGAVRSYFMAGRRRCAWRSVKDLLAEGKGTVSLIVEALIGCASPHLLAKLNSTRRWLRDRGL